MMKRARNTGLSFFEQFRKAAVYQKTSNHEEKRRIHRQGYPPYHRGSNCYSVHRRSAHFRHSRNHSSDCRCSSPADRPLQLLWSLQRFRHLYLQAEIVQNKHKRQDPVTHSAGSFSLVHWPDIFKESSSHSPVSSPDQHRAHSPTPWLR